MKTVVVRRIASNPLRRSGETWTRIVDIIAPDPKSVARSELRRVAGVAASVINSEASKDHPIIVYGHGPRLRIYCVFGDDAITGDDVNEDPLVTCPTNGDWSMSLPSTSEDLRWIQDELQRLSSRVTARAPDEDARSADTRINETQTFTVDKEAFFKP